MTFRYQPIEPRQFAVGAGPFRARGLAFAAALRYVEKKLPGGRPTLDAALGAGDPYARFYDQIFLAIADYDVSPLMRLYEVLARLEGVPIARFIAERARRSGELDPKGVWKRPLGGATAAEVASRLHFAFLRYFPPCGAEPKHTQARRFEGELSKLPACMNGLYAQSTVGFYAGALEGAGAHDVQVELGRPVADGLHTGVPVERLPFSVTWRD